MMSAMPKQGTNTLWTEAADTATDLDNLIVPQGETKNSYKKFYSDKKKCFASMDYLKTFGKKVIVADRTKIKANCVTVARNASGYDSQESVYGHLQVIQSQDKKYHIK